MKTCASCPTPAKCKKAGKCLMSKMAKAAKMAKGGLGKLKSPSIMIAIAIPKTPKVKVPKAKK